MLRRVQGPRRIRRGSIHPGQERAGGDGPATWIPEPLQLEAAQRALPPEAIPPRRVRGGEDVGALRGAPRRGGRRVREKLRDQRAAAAATREPQLLAPPRGPVEDGREALQRSGLRLLRQRRRDRVRHCAPDPNEVAPKSPPARAVQECHRRALHSGGVHLDHTLVGERGGNALEAIGVVHDGGGVSGRHAGGLVLIPGSVTHQHGGAKQTG
mmetsp:Transcript_31918/g.51109  ORF Transcript_31918/g.51109 Transcript_31918/m.51109 type:complete len:212 (-) Transcript_31918:268-903(-)